MSSNILSEMQVDFFNKQGYLLVENLLTQNEIDEYRNIYEDFLSNKIESADYRGDLAGQLEETGNKIKVERSL